MFALLASLIVAAAGQAPAGPPLLPDVEVPRYLRSGEVSEWGNALRLVEQGASRVQSGQGVIGSASLPRIGEKPEEVRARGEKMIAEGKALIARAQPSLARLRLAATNRQIELTKPVSFGLELTQADWNYSANLVAVRSQKIARDNGYAQVHLVGAVACLADGKIAPAPQVGETLRSAWAKVEPKGLAPVPTGGYAYLVNSAEPLPAFAKEWRKPSGPRQTAVVWAELHPLSADSSLALLVVNFADAYTLQLVGCEVVLTTFGPAEPPAKAFSGFLSLKDERNLLRRLVGTPEAAAAFERDASPLGAALLRYLALRDAGLPVPVAPQLSLVVGGDPALPEKTRATWKVSPAPLVEDPATKVKPSPFSRAFAIASAPSGAKPVDVGQLLLRLDPPATPTPAAGKPAGK